MKEALEIGKLLRASITGCVVGCAVTQLEAPQFGGMVRIPLEAGYQVFGLIYDIHIDDDGLVRQLVTAREPVSREVIEDNRLNRHLSLLAGRNCPLHPCRALWLLQAPAAGRGLAGGRIAGRTPQTGRGRQPDAGQSRGGPRVAQPGHPGIDRAAAGRLPNVDGCFRGNWRFITLPRTDAMAENSNSNSNPKNTAVGYIVGGSLKENLRVRLTVAPQQIQEGAFVVVDSGDWRFYGLVTDLILGSTDPRFADEQSELRLPAELASLLHGQTLYTTLEVLPPLMRNIGPDPEKPNYAALKAEWDKLYPNGSPLISIKTIPSHHAPVRLANEGDISEIFGKPDDPDNFVIGYTREQNYPVCINLKKFVMRSAGIFGATGTGKSFLTRLLLSGLIKYNQSSVLVFDMHNEYGFDDTSETNQKVTGLHTIFGSGRVQIVGLGRGASIRGQSPDFTLEIAESDIATEDVEMLTRELNLKETTPATLAGLWHSFHDHWFSEFKALKVGAMIETDDGKKVPAPDSVAAWANEAGVNVIAAEGLHNKLNRLFNAPYIVEKTAADSLGQIIQSLSAGRHVVLSFGDFESDLDYLLISNLLTRKIRAEWEMMTNAYRSHPDKNPEPRPLVIAVEEAHKLLNHEMAAQTAFSAIAREMRKYYVTLLIIDQRPSQIYDEVMSQLGTRVSGWLGDENDIQSVLSGLAGRDALRGMLARLQPKEEVLLLGWGVPMPIPVHTRRYDEHFVQQMRGRGAGVRTINDILKEI